MKRLLAQSFTTIFVLFLSIHVKANNYSQIYVFGDSLSDNGNLMALDPSFPERFSNGPLAAELVAHAYGLSLSPSYHLIPVPPTGNNFAIAGAKTVDDDRDETTPDINLPTQVNAFLLQQGGIAPQEALYLIIIGGNDVRFARDTYVQAVLASNGNSRRCQLKNDAKSYIHEAANAEIKQIKKLIKAGAKNIMVLNAPNIGLTPETTLIALGLAQNSTSKHLLKLANALPEITSSFGETFNETLNKQLDKLSRHSTVDIRTFDLFSVLAQHISHADKFGYTYTATPCIWAFSRGGEINEQCTDFPVASEFLFWDEIHVTKLMHQYTAEAIIRILMRSGKSRHR